MYGTLRINWSATALESKYGDIYVGGFGVEDSIRWAYYKSHFELLHLDKKGDLKRMYRSPKDSVYGPIEDMVFTDDGCIILAASKGYQHHYIVGVNTPRAELVVYPSLLKIDTSDFSIVWENVYKQGGGPYPMRLNFKRIIKTHDNSGYVAGGTIFVVDPRDTVPLPPAGFGYKYFDTRGFLVKVNTHGDTLWNRMYQHLYFTETGHHIMDFEQAADNGFIAVGNANGDDPEDPIDPPIQSWILKVDEYGCLIPNCHITSTQEEPEKGEIPIMVYPNPVQDELYFLIPKEAEGSRYQLNLIDMSGRVLESHERIEKGVNYIMDMSKYPTGEYFLHIRNTEGIGFSKKIIKIN